MYVNGPFFKCPDRGEWIALTNVDSDGNVKLLGYLTPDVVRNVADTLRELHAKVAETGWHSADQVMAWEDYVAFAEAANRLARPPTDPV